MRRFLRALLFLLSAHAVGLFILALFRLVLFITLHHQLSKPAREDVFMQSIAFVRGVWFDNVIACYLLLLPLVVLLFMGLLNYYKKGVFVFLSIYLTLLYIPVFAASAANTPYFEYFFKNINSSIFNWFDYGSTTVSMIFGTSAFYLHIACFLAASIAFGLIVRKLMNLFLKQMRRLPASPLSWQKRASILLVGSCCIGLCLFGIRGRRGYNPIKVSAAYYCQDPFLNQLGINPTFNLLTSFIDEQRPENQELHLMADSVAIGNVQKYLGIDAPEDASPIARKVTPAGAPRKANVVLVFMESMSAQLMHRFGNEKNLTPFLDSLYRQSVSFPNFYSAGIHTNHGIYATLYSFPAIMKRNAMKGSVVPVYSGLPTVLKQNGYRNLFFMTHESQYDNMNAFLRTNGYDEIYAQENYPPEKVVNSFGVQDDFLYQYALPVLRRQAAKGAPFFATLLSISNHPPYVIPKGFHARSRKEEEQIVEFADASLRDFMQQAEKEPWFSNTFFVFVGDHGKMVGDPESEIPQSYNHVPLMIYSSQLTPGEQTGFGGQIDIAPTLLGLLNMGYVQNNFGVNLLQTRRPGIFYTADNLMAARDSSSLYVCKEDGQEFFYRTEGETTRPVATADKKHLALKKYCFSMLQAAEGLVKQGKTKDHP